MQNLHFFFKIIPVIKRSRKQYFEFNENSQTESVENIDDNLVGMEESDDEVNNNEMDVGEGIIQTEEIAHYSNLEEEELEQEEEELEQEIKDLDDDDYDFDDSSFQGDKNKLNLERFALECDR